MTTIFTALPFLLAAPEAGSAGSGGSMVTTFITFGLIIAVFYFLIIRPQRKREKETKAMIAAVKKGDKVVTIGGIRGTVASVKDSVVVLKVDDNTKLEFNKSAISGVLDKKQEAEKVEKIEAAEQPEAPAEEKPAKPAAAAASKSSSSARQGGQSKRPPKAKPAAPEAVEKPEKPEQSE